MQENIDWLAALRSTGNVQTSAVGELRAVLSKALHKALHTRAEVSAQHIEDFTQDAIVRVLHSLDRFEGRSKFTTWAIAIAIDTAMAQLRRKHWQNVSLDDLIERGQHLAEPATQPVEFETHEDQARILQHMRQAIAEQLTDKQRAAIAGQLDGISVDELVQTLGTTPGALYKLIHDARRALKAHFLAAGITAEQIRTAFAP